MASKVERAKLPEFLNPSGSLLAFQERMRQDGYEVIGSGFEARVWAKDNTHVIKEVIANSAYADYLEIVLANQENPYFPRVFDVKRFRNVPYADGDKDGYDYMLVSMERLTPGGVVVDEATLNKLREFSTNIEAAAGSAPWGGKTEPDKKARKKFRTKHEKVMLAAMTELSNKHDGLDLHGANVMLRGKQPVIIDPVYS